MTAAKRTAPGRIVPLGWGEGDESAEGALGRGAVGCSSSAPGPTQTPGTETRPRLRPRRRAGLALAGAVAVVLALVLILPRLLLVGAAPEDEVREYLDALVAADVTTLREHLATTAEASDAALTQEVLLAAEDRVTDYSIDAVERAGQQVTVTATLRSGATSQQSTFTVLPESGSSFAPATWRLEAIPTDVFAVSIPGHAEALLVNGVAFPLSALPTRSTDYDQRVMSLALLPGTYELTLPESGELLVPMPEQVAVPLPGGELRQAGAVLGYDLSETGRDLVTAQIDELLEDCAAATTDAPPDCPFAAAELSVDGSPVNDGEAAEGTWEVTAPAEYEIERWVSATWSVESELGQATFTPTPTPDGSTAPPQQINFLIDGVTWLSPTGELQTDLRSGQSIVAVGCADSRTGLVVPAGPVSEGDAASACEDVV